MTRHRKRKARRRSENPMHLDYDNLDAILDESMGRLDETMERLDERLDMTMIDMDKKLEKAMAAVENVARKTTKRQRTQSQPTRNHVLKTAQKIANAGRRKKQTVTITDRYFMEDPGPAENVWSEDFAGNLKQPMSESLRMDTKVKVASRPGLSAILMPNHPKYQVYVDGTEVHMHKMEDMMYRTTTMPGTADIFIESWLKDWSDEEQHFLREALRGVVALKLNRKYHDETLSVLDKRLSKQRDGNGDVGDSLGANGGS